MLRATQPNEFSLRVNLASCKRVFLQSISHPSPFSSLAIIPSVPRLLSHILALSPILCPRSVQHARRQMGRQTFFAEAPSHQRIELVLALLALKARWWTRESLKQQKTLCPRSRRPGSGCLPLGILPIGRWGRGTVDHHWAIIATETSSLERQSSITALRRVAWITRPSHHHSHLHLLYFCR